MALKDDLLQISKDAEKIDAEAQNLAEVSDMSTFVTGAFSLQARTEKLCQRARLLPIKTGLPTAKRKVADTVVQATPIVVDSDLRGWFKISIPALLPKKEKGGVEYIRDTICFGLEKYFQTHPKHTLDKLSLMAFHHIYSSNYPLRLLRDHDNIEINAVADIITVNFLMDDGPLICHNMQYTSLGIQDMTEIYVVPVNHISQWVNEIYLPEVQQQI